MFHLRIEMCLRNMKQECLEVQSKFFDPFFSNLLRENIYQ